MSFTESLEQRLTPMLTPMLYLVNLDRS